MSLNECTVYTVEFTGSKVKVTAQTESEEMPIAGQKCVKIKRKY